MSSAFVIEIMHRTAGLAVSERDGYRFHASDPLFRRIDGKKFRKLKTVHAAVADLIELAREVESYQGSLAKFVGLGGSGVAPRERSDAVWWRSEPASRAVADGGW